MADAIQEREQRLIRSERLATVGRMAAQIAHEVRNPLASIGLNAELLGDEIAERGEEAQRLVTSIIGEVDRLTEITETYLRFARLPRPKLERENLAAIVASVVEISRGELAQAGVAVDRRRRARAARGRRRRGAAPAGADQPGAQRARGDVGRGGARRLEISVRESAGRIAVAIHDSGPGIGAARHRARSSTRSSRRRSAAPGSGWRWCSRSSSITAARSRSRARRARGRRSR